MAYFTDAGNRMRAIYLNEWISGVFADFYGGMKTVN